MKLLWISNDPRLLYVGQSRVTREILLRLHNAGIEVHATAIGGGDSYYDVPYSVHSYIGERHAYPKPLIEQLKPDCIVCSHDCWLFYWLQQCRLDFPNIKLVGYYTLDGGPIHGSWVRTMQPLDLLVTPTQFGKKQIYQRYPERHVAVIPYGVDHQFFSVQGTKKELKETTDRKSKEATQDALTVSGKCIFTFVGQNQGRKNIAGALEGFAMADLPDSHFFAVTHCSEQALGGWQGMGDYDLIDLVGTFEHRERVTIGIDPASDNALKDLYGITDYFVLPSQGEAPGLPLLESMACGCIPITTDYAGGTEVAAGYKLPYTPFRGQFNVIRAMVNPKDIASAMVKAHAAWKDGSNVSHIEECQRVSKSFTWEKTSVLWLQYIDGLMNDRVLVDTELERCL